MSKILGTVAVCGLLLPTLAAAQVGHAPDASPYEDIRIRSSLVGIGGIIGGSGGRLDVGPANGPLVGLQYELELSGPTDAFFSISQGRLDRVVIDPTLGVAARVTDSVRQSVLFVQAGLSILLTGSKTWHGFAPYLGGSLGLAFGSDVPQDPTEFGFSAKFVTGPHLGIRWYPTRALHLRLEGRQLFWQLKYPQSYFNDPVQAPGDPPVLDVQSDPESEWTAHPTLLFAVGYAFRL